MCDVFQNNLNNLIFRTILIYKCVQFLIYIMIRIWLSKMSNQLLQNYYQHFCHQLQIIAYKT